MIGDSVGSIPHGIPKVSVVLPTFNRARFLPRAFASITSQSLSSWELLVVDDGSTDSTADVVSLFARDCARAVVYINQSNQGPAAARNAAIRMARGELIAFYDSDDEWTETHLERCASALDENADVHWVYGSFTRSRFGSGQVIEPNIFYPGGQPSRFLSLKTSQRGALHVIEDARALECAIMHGIGVGLKVSVLRRNVFDDLLIPNFRVGEDQALIPRMLAKGMRFGYLDEIHGTAYVHDDNISTVAGTVALDRAIRVLGELVRALESLSDLPLRRAERQALHHRIAVELFWNMGYVCISAGRQEQGLCYMRRALRLWPVNLKFWKSYVLARVRSRLQ